MLCNFSAVFDTWLHSPSSLPATIILFYFVFSPIPLYLSQSLLFFPVFLLFKCWSQPRILPSAFLFITLSSWVISSSLTASATAYTETLSTHFYSEPHFYIFIFWTSAPRPLCRPSNSVYLYYLWPKPDPKFHSQTNKSASLQLSRIEVESSLLSLSLSYPYPITNFYEFSLKCSQICFLLLLLTVTV